MDKIIQGDNLEVLKTFDDEVFDLIYADPPFNTGVNQTKKTLKMNRGGERDGFGGNRYDVQELAKLQYKDYFDNYYQFLFPRLEEFYRVLKNSGSCFLHLDWRETHYVRVFLDGLFGRENCLNEIIWSWDYGAKSKKYFPRKHSNILWYVKDLEQYVFDIQQMERLPYLAPELVSKEKAELGKLPTDSWWLSIVGTNSREKTSYPTQKPEKLLRRIILPTTGIGDLVLDPFAGSGTTGKVCQDLQREFVLIDSNPEAIEIMNNRLFPKYKELLK